MKGKLGVSVLALLVSFAAFAYKVWWDNEKEQIDAFSEVQKVAVPNVNQFNGIMNSNILKIKADPTHKLNDDDYIKLAKIYSEVRDIYGIKINYFEKSDRKKIDSEIATLEDKFIRGVEDPLKGIDIITQMSDIMKLIELSSR